MLQAAEPILMLTANAVLWRHWQTLRSDRWLPQHGATAADLQAWCTQAQRWALLDADLPGLPAWAERAHGTLFRQQHILVLSTRPSVEQGHHALAQGASGYAHALTPTKALNHILETIAHGGIWTGRALLERLLADVGERLPPVESPWHEAAWTAALTARERMVAERAALGRSNGDIAQELNITERTVRAHLSATFEKLQVSDRLQLALKVHGISR